MKRNKLLVCTKNLITVELMVQTCISTASGRSRNLLVEGGGQIYIIYTSTVKPVF